MCKHMKFPKSGEMIHPVGIYIDILKNSQKASYFLILFFGKIFIFKLLIYLYTIGTIRSKLKMYII